MFGGFTSPQSGVQLGPFSELASIRPSPQTHGFCRGNVRFEEQPTVHWVSDYSEKKPDQTPDYSEIKPGMTPILPDERSTTFSRWCDERRRRVNDSEEFRRKRTRALAPPARANDARAGIDSRRSSMGQTLRGSPGMGLGGSSGMSSAVDRWWRSLDTKLDWQPGHRASDYCLQILSEQRLRSLAPQTRHGLDPAAALLEQTSRGIRRWIGFQVVRHVLKLMDQVEKDAADGLHKKVALKNPAPAAAPAPGAFGAPAAGAFGVSAAGAFGAFGGTFGAPAPAAAAPSAAETAKARQEELKRGNALDRQSQVVCLCVGAASRCTLKGSPRAHSTPCAGGCGRRRALATAVQ
jgi:hypothetical protein